MSADRLPWLEPAWERLLARRQQGRLPQVLLLAGPRGLGKEMFARRLAALLLCEAEAQGQPCGNCRSCTQMAAGTHPDALLLSTDGLHCVAGPDPQKQAEAIPIWTPDRDSKKRDIAADGIRSLIERLMLSGHYGKAKVAVLSPADALNTSGANMLLKMIEEPPSATHLVLVAERWRELPATLRSRCQLWRMAAPAAELSMPWLRDRHPGKSDSDLLTYAKSPLLAAAALEPERAEQQAQWARVLSTHQGGRWQGLKLEDARFGLECWHELATAWLKQRLAPAKGGPVVPAGLDAQRLSGLLERIQQGMRGLERNGNPALIMESIIIRSAGQPAKEKQWLDPAAHNPAS